MGIAHHRDTATGGCGKWITFKYTFFTVGKKKSISIVMAPYVDTGLKMAGVNGT